MKDRRSRLVADRLRRTGRRGRRAARPGRRSELDDVPDDEVVIAGGHHVVDVAVELGERFADGIEPVRRSPYVVVREDRRRGGQSRAPSARCPRCRIETAKRPDFADDAQRAGVVRERRRVRAADRARSDVKLFSVMPAVRPSWWAVTTHTPVGNEPTRLAEGVLDVEIGHGRCAHGAAVPDRHALDAVEEVRPEPLGRARRARGAGAAAASPRARSAARAGRGGRRGRSAGRRDRTRTWRLGARPTSNRRGSGNCALVAVRGDVPEDAPCRSPGSTRRAARRHASPYGGSAARASPSG